MKIGILLCGDTPLSLVPAHGCYADCLKDQFGFDQLGDIYVWNVYQEQEIPQGVDDCDAYIVGGSPAGVNDGFHWIELISSFLRKAFHAGKKIVGICFGHQLIHHSLGGSVQRSADGWGLGAYPVEFNKNFHSFKKGEEVSIFSMHQDQVIKLADGFEIIAGNDFCPNYMTCLDNQVLTVQGHPEFERSFFQDLLNERKNKFIGIDLEEIVRLEEHRREGFNRTVHSFFQQKL